MTRHQQTAVLSESDTEAALTNVSVIAVGESTASIVERAKRGGQSSEPGCGNRGSKGD